MPRTKNDKTEPKDLRIVREGCVLFWPVRSSGHPPLRGHAGTVVPADDPLLDTSNIPEDLRRELGLLKNADQRHKTDEAPPGSRVSTHSSLPAKALYDRLDYTDVPYALPSDADASPSPAPKPRAPTRRRAAATIPPIDGED